MPSRAVICARVSSDQQAEKGSSIQTQLAAMRDYAIRAGFEVIKELADDISGTVPIRQRPAGSELYRYIDERKADAVIFYTIDRVTRDDDVIEIHQLRKDIRKAGMELHYANDGGKADLSSIGSVLDHFKAAMAADERGKIKERTRRGIKAKLKSGKAHLGGVARYGYRFANDTLEPDPDTADTVKNIFEWYAGAGDERGQRLSIYAIAKRLSTSNVPTPFARFPDRRPNKNAPPTSKKSWSASSVHRILRDETYAGVWRYGKKGGTEVISVSVEALVSRGLFDAAQKMLIANKNVGGREPIHNALFRGMVTCGVCGGPMQAIYKYSTYKGKRYEWIGYICHRRNHARTGDDRCTQSAMKATWLDDAVWNEIVKLFMDSITFKIAVDRALSQELSNLPKLQTRLDEIKAAIIENNREARELAAKLPNVRKGGVLEDVLVQQINTVEETHIELTREADDIRAAIRRGDEAKERAAKAIELQHKAREGIKRMSRAHGDELFEQRRAFVEALSVEVTLTGRRASIVCDIQMIEPITVFAMP